jgi:hypothetical protein
MLNGLILNGAFETVLNPGFKKKKALLPQGLLIQTYGSLCD